MSSSAPSERPEPVQRFKFYADASAVVREYESDLEDLSVKGADAIRATMTRHIESRGLDVARRYVAVGSWGDCVICDDGVVDQVAESG